MKRVVLMTFLIASTFSLPKPVTEKKEQKKANENKESKVTTEIVTDSGAENKETEKKILAEASTKNSTGSDNVDIEKANVTETDVADGEKANDTQDNRGGNEKDIIKSVEEYEEDVEEIYTDNEDDVLGAEAVKGSKMNFIEDLEEDLYLPVSSRLKRILLPEADRVVDEPDFLPRADAVMEEPNFLPRADAVMEEPDFLPRADAVMEEPDFLPRADAVMEEPDYISRAQRVLEPNSALPSSERVMEQPTGTKSGGDGKMKMTLNLKDLDGNPSDLTVGAAAVGLMSQAVKAKGPDDNQVNAVAGFGHEIMGLVSELEKDTK